MLAPAWRRSTRLDTFDAECTDTVRGAAPAIGGCPVFPPDSVWNARVDTLPVHPQSAAWIATIGSAKPLHPDFGTVYAGAPNGIPYVVVPAGAPGIAVSFDYADESDPGPYPIPSDPPIEGGPASTGDRHVLVVEAEGCRLYELYAAYPNGDGSWRAGSGAIFDLRSNALRPSTWTSADAAGLPVLPGLVRFDEASAGEIAHALEIIDHLLVRDDQRRDVVLRWHRRFELLELRDLGQRAESADRISPQRAHAFRDRRDQAVGFAPLVVAAVAPGTQGLDEEVAVRRV